MIRSYRLRAGRLSLHTHEPREPAAGEVAVAVRAVSLSYRDLLIMRGKYLLPVAPDVVPVSDGAGEVVAVGPGVDGVAVGDRVSAALFPKWTDGPLGDLSQLGGSMDGMLTGHAVLPGEAIVAVPGHLSYAEAATLPCAAVTAWNALTGDGNAVRPGQTVLTTGSGGVSLFAVRFAKVLGARVIATTGHRDKEARLRALGADDVINYRTTPDWPATVRDLTGGRGADRIVDTAGTPDRSLAAIALQGQIALVGSLSGSWPAIDTRRLLGAAATIRTLAVGSRAQFRAMNQVITEHRLRPVIDRTFGFEEAAEAYRYYASAAPFGKVVIEIGQG